MSCPPNTSLIICNETPNEVLYDKHTNPRNKQQYTVSLYTLCEEFGPKVTDRAQEDPNGLIDDLAVLLSARCPQGHLLLPRPAKRKGNHAKGVLPLVVWWVIDRCCPETMEHVDDDDDVGDENKPGKHKILLLDEVRKLIYWRFVLNQTDLPGEPKGRGALRRKEDWPTQYLWLCKGGKRIVWEKLCCNKVKLSEREKTP